MLFVLNFKHYFHHVHTKRAVNTHNASQKKKSPQTSKKEPKKQTKTKITTQNYIQISHLANNPRVFRNSKQVIHLASHKARKLKKKSEEEKEKNTNSQYSPELFQ